MYDYIKGKIVETGKNYAVVETGGVGYYINTTSQTLAQIDVGQTAKLNCQFIVREDAHMLYGFYAPEEKSMFVKLISVSGVGPKVALAILSAMSVSELATAIITSDDGAFQKVSGVGKKTAARLIIDLVEKIETSEAIQMSDVSLGRVANKESEAIAALVSLGYSRGEAVRAVAAVKNLADTAEDIILMALKRISG